MSALASSAIAGRQDECPRTAEVQEPTRTLSASATCKQLRADFEQDYIGAFANFGYSIGAENCKALCADGKSAVCQL